MKDVARKTIEYGFSNSPECRKLVLGVALLVALFGTIVIAAIY